MNRLVLFSLSCFALSPLFGQAPVAGDGNWPREIDSGNVHLVIYQPQVESWKDNRIEARSAVIVTRREDPTQIFGIVSINARTEVDRETRLVSFEDITIKDANFPSAASVQSTLLQAVRDSVPNWPRTVSLDRLLADLSITQSEAKAESIRLKNSPPRIIFSKGPAVLILIDGEPEYRPVDGTRYTRVVNTPALLLFDPAAGTFYLDGGQWWMTASSLKGPWTAATNPPQDLDEIRQQVKQSEQEEPGVPTSNIPAGNPPAVYVSTVPAELIVTRGEPTYAPIPKTSLLYVTDSENDIFMDTKSQQYYTLLAGRWFRAKSLEGAWEWVPGEQLPHDFARLSPDSPKGHVLASIPGTEQAREAVIANQIPQTATVRRAEAKLNVKYAGPPEFRPITGTDMEYAINTSSEVIHAEGHYYAVEHGVWFAADDPEGPWAVADMIPACIYTIPPSSPLFHDRYVYVYGATPEYVYVGYTPGYMGAFVDDGVVVFGTGWWYPGMWCGDFWCGWPWTWGFGFQFSYWGGGWFWRPGRSLLVVSHDTGRTSRFLRTLEPALGRPQPDLGSRQCERLQSLGRQRRCCAHLSTPRHNLAARQSRTSGCVRRPGRADLRASFRRLVSAENAGQWQKTPANPSLEQQRESRSFGQTRQREFESRGQSPGIPRTVAPPRMSAPSMRSAPSGGRGGHR